MTQSVSSTEVQERTTPPGWVQTTVGEVYDLVGGGTPSTKNPEYWDGDIPWISSADIHGLREVVPRRNVTQSGIENSATNVVPAGSLIVVTRVGLGKVTIAPTALCFSQDSQALTGNKHVFPEYALYYLSEAVRTFKHHGRGTTISGVTKKQLEELPLLLPPCQEQRRIVQKIEELFTKLDSGIQSLKQAQALLKRYRQSVLKAVFEGELSREWREVHEGEVEPASALLNAIVEKRRAEYGDRVFKGLEAPDAAALTNLPEGWEWAQLGQVFDVYVGATPSRREPSYWNGDISWVSSGEVAFCRIKETRETITKAGLDNSSTIVHPPGTVLLGMIGEGKTRGQAAILDIRACHNQNSAAIRVSEAGLSPEYIYYFLQGEYARTRRLGSGNNQPALNRSRVRNMVFPVPPLAEQMFITHELERRFSMVDAVEAAITGNLKRAEHLRRSILKQAFSGELVRQNPDDESASILLERIKEEKKRRETKLQRQRKAEPKERDGIEQGELF